MEIPACICVVFALLEVVVAVLALGGLALGFLWVIWYIIGRLYWSVREDLIPDMWAILRNRRTQDQRDS